jgi:large-conductance mechanosensitive channel
MREKSSASFTEKFKITFRFFCCFINFLFFCSGIALTPVVYKYVNKYYRQLEQHVEENENSVIEQTQNLLHNVPQLLADYQSQIQGLSRHT